MCPTAAALEHCLAASGPVVIGHRKGTSAQVQVPCMWVCSARAAQLLVNDRTLLFCEGRRVVCISEGQLYNCITYIHPAKPPRRQ